MPGNAAPLPPNPRERFPPCPAVHTHTHTPTLVDALGNVWESLGCRQFLLALIVAGKSLLLLTVGVCCSLASVDGAAHVGAV